METRVEDVNEDRDGFLDRLTRHLEIKVMPQIDWSRSFSDSGARCWREHFTPRIEATFFSRYGQALTHLGYD